MTRARELADLLTGGQTITTADNNPQLTLESTDADANFGPVLKMHRNSGSPADSDFLGELQLKGENDAGEEILYAQMFGRTGDVSDGTEDGRIATKIMIAGTAQNVLDIKSDEIVINDDSVDLDFRVESNGDTHMLFVDGGTDRVGIGKSGPEANLHVIGNATDLNSSDNAMIIEGGDAGGNRGIHIGQIGDGSQARMFLQGFHSQAISNYWDLSLNPNGGNVTVGTDEPSLFNSEGTSAGLTVAGSDTSTTTIGNGGAAINIVQTDGTAGNTSGLHFSRQDTDGTPNYSGAAIVAQFPDAQATGQYPKGRLAFNTSTSANAAPSEKMRLESSGTLFVNETSTNLPCKVHINFSGSAEQGLVLENSVNNSSGAAIRFVDHTDAHTGGGVYFSDSNNINYATSSDVRLKENIADMTGAIDRVKALAPKRFNFITTPDTTVDGFLAHEAQVVVPEAVNGTHNQVEVWVEPQVDDRKNIISGEALPDGVSVGDNKLDADGNTIPVYQGIDHSKLVPLLTGALQEAIAKIETLETKVAALEAG